MKCERDSNAYTRVPNNFSGTDAAIFGISLQQANELHAHPSPLVPFLSGTATLGDDSAVSHAGTGGPLLATLSSIITGRYSS